MLEKKVGVAIPLPNAIAVDAQIRTLTTKKKKSVHNDAVTMPYAHEVRFFAVPMVVLLTWRQSMGNEEGGKSQRTLVANLSEVKDSFIWAARGERFNTI